MKLPPDAIVSERKLREYLLTQRSEDDKSGFLALAGYDSTGWRQLETDLRQLMHDQDAQLIRVTPYGERYNVEGSLTGPNGRVLNVMTI